MVTAMTSPENADNLRKAGADAIFYRDDPLPPGALTSWLMLLRGPRWPDMIASLKRAGRYVVSGAIAGPIVELDVRTLYLNDLSLLGSTFQPLNIMEDVISYVEQGLLCPMWRQFSGCRTSSRRRLPFRTRAISARSPSWV